MILINAQVLGVIAEAISFSLLLCIFISSFELTADRPNKRAKLVSALYALLKTALPFQGIAVETTGLVLLTASSTAGF